MGSRGPAHPDEIDELTLRAVAFLDRCSYAQARRNALSERCAELRAEQPELAELVQLQLKMRRERSNVVPMRRRRKA